ncbi:MAG: Anaerobic nitric oxide reductase transcription regulator NorR [Acidobacteria bacterium]|nr:Anaerobic nitric oxide reductase transcription regulator NorR [Acidobacteriota bacterium]
MRGPLPQSFVQWPCLFTCGLLVWLVPLLHAQPAPELKFQQVATGHIISEIEIGDIVQDRQGFLWIGSKAGLFRYDGYNLTPYLHDPRIPHSLARNDVFRLLLDRAGRLWVGLDGGGLDRYDPQINGFIHYRHDPNNPASLSHDTVRGLWEDQTGRIWIGTRQGGVNVFDPNTGIFTHYRHDPNNPHSLSHDNVYRGLQDRAGIHWLGTLNGLNRFDPISQIFTRLPPAPDEPPEAPVNQIFALVEDRAGYLWAGTPYGKVHRYDRGANSFKTYSYKPGQPGSLGGNRGVVLFADGQGGVWIGFYGAGLDRYDPASDSFTHYRADRSNPHSLPNDAIGGLFEDRAGVLWIGTHQGLCKYDRFSANFVAGHAALGATELKEAVVKTVFEDRVGRLWFGTTKGLAQFDPGSGRVTVYQHDPARADSLSDSDVEVIYQDGAGRIWVGTDLGGLNLFDPARRRFKRYQIKNPANSNPAVFTFYEDRRGRLLISSWLNGLQQYDSSTDSFAPFQPAGMPKAINTDTAFAMHEDAAGRLWLGLRFGGLARYDPATGQWRTFRHNPADERSLSDDQVYGWLEDSRGQIWVATANGLNRFEPQKESFTRFTTREGLPDNFIASLQEDAQGRLWLGTNNGLSRFDLVSGAVRNYDTSDGLPGNRFKERAALRHRSGELLFGTVKGLVRFNPDAIQDRPSPITVALTEVRKYEQPFQFGPVVSSLSTLDFSWRDDVLTFEFAALGLRQPQKANYAWRLEGHDQNWIAGGAKRAATYTDLAGGSYTLRVKATDDAGRWSENELAVRVNVSAPPWLRWWAYALYVLTLAGAIFGYVRFKTRAQIKRVRELDSLVTQRTEQVREKNSQLEQTLGKLTLAQSELLEANDDLLAVLDQLRLGVLVAEPDGTVSFLSQTARNLLNVTQEKDIGQAWERFLPLPEQEKVQLKSLLALPEKQRARLPVSIHAAGGRRYQLEIEIADDPRNPQRKIFYLYDVSEIYDLRRLLDEKAKFHELIGESTAMRIVFKQARDVAQTDTTVLLEGETGTGKELVARAIHYSGPRKSQPFIALNCAGLTESLLNSQLFGHKRGAFTGAVSDQLGLFEAASGGTLFLDEIGDIPLTVQTALLRVLQEREITRLGENKPRKVDVRIITATHRDLNQRVALGEFREDFLYRIRVARIKLPPLRERLEDMPLLVAWFLGQFRASFGREQLDISAEAMDCLLGYAWPGNVRELRSAIESAVIQCRGAVIQPADLPPEIFGRLANIIQPASEITGVDERQRLLLALKQTSGNRAAAARLLGISRPTLYRRLKELGLDEDEAS